MPSSVVSSYERDKKKRSQSVKGEDYLGKLNVYQRLKKNSAEEIIWFPARQIRL
jgi:hypothetical protein